MFTTKVKILSFISVKLMTAILLFYFVQFIKEENNAFIYTFLSFYLIERVFTLLISIVSLDLSCWEKLLLIILNPIQLDEFYFLLRRHKHQSYINEGIFIQAVLIVLLSLPNLIISIIWTQLHLTYLYVILQTVILTFIITYLLLLVARLSFSFQFDFQNQNEYLSFIKAHIFAIIHFVSYVWLICMNFKLQNFGYYFLLVQALLIITFIPQIYKIVNQVYLFNYQKYALCLIFMMKEILHINIDPRDLKDKWMKITSQRFGYLVYDRMTIYQFIIKLYLLLTFAIQFEYLQNLNSKIQIDIYILFIVSIISALLLGFNISKNTIWQYIFGSSYLEFYSVESYLFKSYNKNKDFEKDIEMIKIYSIFLQKDEYIDLIKTFIFFHKSSQIISDFAKRENINNKTWQRVSYQFEINIEFISQIVQQQKLLPQIEKVDFSVSSDNDIYQTYSQLVQNNLGVWFTTTYDDEELQILNKELFFKVKQTSSQLFVYEDYISQYLITNPYIVFFDLFNVQYE